MLDDFLRALCLVLVIEGMLPFLAPSQWRRMVLSMADADDQVLRITGLILMVIGVACLFLVNRGVS